MSEDSATGGRASDGGSAGKNGGSISDGAGPGSGGFVGSAGAFGLAGTPSSAGGMPSGGGAPGSGGQPTSGGFGGFPIGGEPNAGGSPGVLNDVIWARSFGDDQIEQIAYGIAVGDNGDFGITGSFRGTLDFGLGDLDSSEGPDVFLAKFDEDANPLWSQSYGSPGSSEGQAISIAPDGALAITGQFGGTIDFGGGTLTSKGGYDVFVSAFEDDGTYRFSGGYGDWGNSYGLGIAFGFGDDAAVTGYFASSVDFGGGTLTSTGSVDAFIADFKKDGAHNWSQRAGNALAQRANAIARGNNNHLFVAGEFQGTMKVGACSTVTTAGGYDGYLLWVDQQGNCLKQLRFGDAAEQRVLTVAHAVAGGPILAIAGTAGGTFDFGTTFTAQDDEDGFVAPVSHDDFSDGLYPAWIKRIGGPGTATPRGIAFDSLDNIVVVGDYTGSSDDAGLPQSNGGSDAFVIKYDLSGNVLWSKRFGTQKDQIAYAVGIDDANDIYVAGGFEGQIPLQNQTLTSQGAEDIFILKLEP